jgi:hypothetical protein
MNLVHCVRTFVDSSGVLLLYALPLTRLGECFLVIHRFAPEQEGAA